MPKFANAFADSVLSALKRFPLPFLLVLVLYVVTQGERRIFGNEIFFYLAITFVGLVWFVGVQLLTERFLSMRTKMWAYAVGTALLGVIVWWLYTRHSDASQFNSSMTFWLPWLFLSAAFLIAVLIVPYVNAKAQDDSLWMFSYSVLRHSGMALLAAILLFLGVSAILGSLQYLFDVAMPRQTYSEVWKVAALLLMPMIILGRIPRQFNDTMANYPSVQCFILTYIVIPLLLLYGILLYGYGVKILLLQDLPKGGLVYMVSAFCWMGVLTYFAGYPLRHSAGIVGWYVRWFFQLNWGAVVLLAVAIGVRVAEYGITESRYAVLLFLVWLFVCGLAQWGAARQYAMKIVLCSAMLLCLVASVGPLSALDVSKRSQMQRLETLLIDSGLLVDGSIVPAQDKIAAQQQVQISSIVQYLTSTGRANALKPWFAEMKNAELNKIRTRYFRPKHILADMGLHYIDDNLRTQLRKNGKRKFSVSSKHSQQAPIDIAGYDYWVALGPFRVEKGAQKDVVLEEGRNGVTLRVSFDEKQQRYCVAKKGGDAPPVCFVLSELLKPIVATPVAFASVHQEKLTFLGASEELSVKLWLENAQGVVQIDQQHVTISRLKAVVMVGLPANKAVGR